MDPTMLELESGARDRLDDRPRRQDVTCTSKSGDTGTDMHGDTTKIVTAYFALSGMDACSDLQTKMTSTLSHHLCTADGTRWAIETGQETIAGLLDFPAPEMTEAVPDHLVVSLQKLPPGLIAFGSRSFRRVDDVGE